MSGARKSTDAGNYCLKEHVSTMYVYAVLFNTIQPLRALLAVAASDGNDGFISFHHAINQRKREQNRDI